MLLVWIWFGGVSVSMAADRNVRLIVSGGGSFLRAGNIQDLAGASYPAYFKDKFQVGILAAVDLHKSLALETGIRNEWAELQGGTPLTNGRSVRFTVQQIFCNALYSTPYSDGGLRLFATGGAGLRRASPETEVGSQIGLSLNFGGGLEARPSRRFSIRVEIRDFVEDLPRFVPSQSPGGFHHDIQPSIGFVVHMK